MSPIRKLAQLPYNPELKAKARALRQTGNLSEVLLWNALKRKQLGGLDFDRQRIIGNYIVDFYCHAIRLVVEIDGESHEHKITYDAQRDDYLRALGLTVLHIQDIEVKRHLEGVLTQMRRCKIDFEIALAAEKLAAGEVVGLPTETVYGLAADAANLDAVRQIFTIKNRPSTHPLITHIAADADIAYWIDATRMSDEMWRLTRALMAAFSPGPLTLVLPKNPQINDVVTGGQDTMALRSPNHALFQDVLAQLAVLKHSKNVGVAAPSANRFGRVSPTRAEHVRAEFDDAVWVLDGDASVIGIESTIVDLTTGVPRILRFGHVTPQDIERVTGVAPLLPQHANHANNVNTPRVSGSLLAHYAPSTPLVWLGELSDDALSECVLLHHSADLDVSAYSQALCLSDDAVGYARGLYHALRELDALHASRIVVEHLPEHDAWYAVRDRLNRAIVGSNLKD